MEKPEVDQSTLEEGSSLWHDARVRLLANRMAMISLVVLAVVALSAIFGPLFSPYGFAESNLSLGATPPLAVVYERSYPDTPGHPDEGRFAGRHFARDLATHLSLEALDPAAAERLAATVVDQYGDLGPALTAASEWAKEPAWATPEAFAEFLVAGTLTDIEKGFENLRTATSALGTTDRARMLAQLNATRETLRATLDEVAAPTQKRIQAGEAVSLELPSGQTLTYTRTGERHLFGTDEQGRDLFTRVLIGGRVSLGVGLAATLVSLLIGVLYGAVSGFTGGAVDAAMMRGVDILYALPFTIFVILLMTVFERSLLLLFVAIGAVEWLTMSRMVRAKVLELKEQEFVEAARSLGLSTSRIVFRYLIPNTLGPVIVLSTLTIPAVMLLESVLSFLGLGVQAPMSSWGSLIKDGADKMDVYTWLLIFPALFFSLTLFSLNFLGDGLRDALDPKSSKD